MITKVNFETRNEHLSGQFVLAHEKAKPQILFLHGAGQATKERALPLMEKLTDEGISSFSFDFSGHGESSGKLSESSLKKRVMEAESALTFLQPDTWSICAFSMGGHIALELLKRHKCIKNIFLFYPGIYTQAAYNVPFDERFSTTIRRQDSWKEATVVNALDDFTGNLLIVIGKDDHIIPAGVIELLDKRSLKTTKKEIIYVPGATHSLLPTLYNDNVLFDRITHIITDFIRS